MYYDDLSYYNIYGLSDNCHNIWQLQYSKQVWREKNIYLLRKCNESRLDSGKTVKFILSLHKTNIS